MRGLLGMNKEEYKALARSEGFAEDLQKRVLMRLWVKKLLVDEVSWQYKAFSQVSHPDTMCHVCQPMGAVPAALTLQS